MLAEVADKLTSINGSLSLGCIAAVIAFALSRRKRRVALYFIPLVALFDFYALVELMDPDIAPAIQAELGRSWVIGQIAAINTPYLLAIGLTFCRPRRYPPPNCTACGYDLTGNVSGRCPECGSGITATRYRHHLVPSELGLWLLLLVGCAAVAVALNWFSILVWITGYQGC